MGTVQNYLNLSKGDTRNNDENFAKNSDFKENLRFGAANEKFRGILRNLGNLAIYRGRRQISRFRTDRDKLCPCTMVIGKVNIANLDRISNICSFVIRNVLISIFKIKPI